MSSSLSPAFGFGLGCAAISEAGILVLGVAALAPFLAVGAAAVAANEGFRAARLAVYRRRARIDREFAKHCAARLRDLKGAGFSAYVRALRELAAERERLEDDRATETFSAQAGAAAHRAAARARRAGAWRDWFDALEKDIRRGGPRAAARARPPGRRGAPIRRLCKRSVRRPPAPEAVLAQYEAARGRGRVEEKIKLGSMLLDAEAAVDSSLVRNGDGEIVGRRGGLREWIDEACPSLSRHYSALMGYRRLAASFRAEHGLSDPAPAALLLAEAPEDERKLTPSVRAGLPAARAAARKLLAGPDAATVRAFSARLLAMRDARAAALGRRLRA